MWVSGPELHSSTANHERGFSARRSDILLCCKYDGSCPVETEVEVLIDIGL